MIQSDLKLPFRKRMKIRSMFSGIGRKFLFYFFFLAIIPIVLIAYLGYNFSERMMVNQNLRYLELQNELVANRLTDFFQQAQFNLSPQNPANAYFFNWISQLLQQRQNLLPQDLRSIRLFFEEHLQENREFSSISLYNNNGGLIFTTENSPPPVSSGQFRPDTDPDDFNIIMVSAPKRPPEIFIKLPVYSPQQNSPDWILGHISSDAVEGILSYFSSQRQISKIFLTDKYYRFILGGQTASSDRPGEKVQLTINKKGIFTGPDGRKILRSTRYVQQFGWYLVSQSDYREALGDLIRLRNRILLLVGGLLLVLILLALYISQRITIPIRQLVYAAQDIGAGMLDAPIKIKSKDEIGQLAHEFNEMRKSLLDSYENLEKKVQQRTAELKQAQFQIMHQEKMASIGLLAAGIAHEIGNPLTSISSLTQLLKRRLKDDVNLNYLSTIMKNIDRISHIVRELVDFSRPSNYQARLTDVNEVITAAVGIVKYDKRSKNLHFNLELEPQIPPTFLVADQLLQVFINLLFNAVDAMEGFGNTITVQSLHRDNTIQIKIADTGSGIPPEQLDKIFEPFFTTKEVGKGTGLGLSVSYGIIRNFEGNITVESTPGKGSTFYISVPVKTGAARKEKVNGYQNSNR
ncbi:MAG: ATP-binding protein [Calditrichia bacterium]